MALSEPRFLSQPCAVRFAGFESNTYRLQQAGWSLSAEQSFDRERINLALHHPGAGLYMLCRGQGFSYMGRRPYDGPPTVFEVQHCSSRMNVQVMSQSFDFRPIDAQPQFTDAPFRSIEDFAIFAPALTRTEEILIEPSSVAECLDLIKRLQAPDLAEIRNRNRDSSAPVARQNFHAQILSLAA